MSKRTTEITCYVVGSGAFGVFFRWLQDQIAFDDNGLVENSVFNILVPLLLVTIAILFLRFVDKMRNDRFFLPDDFCEALRNDGKLYKIARWTAGGVMIIGSVYLLISCEADKLATFYKILGVCGILTGVSFPFVLTSANKPTAISYKFVCLCTAMPIITFSVWLVTAYKVNSLNSVVWEYAVEIITIIICMIAFFRAGGFAFGVPNAWRSMFFCMLGASMCIVTMADERYMGMQIMLAGASMMLLLYNWIMLTNLRKQEAKPKEYPDDGFDRL